MGTREVYEEKLRNGNLHHDPTIKPGLGTPRCPRCLSPLDSESGDAVWTIAPVLHDVTAVAGSGMGALLSTIHAFNTGIPYAQKYVKGPAWLPFLVGLPPLMLYIAGSAAFGGRYGPQIGPQWELNGLSAGSSMRMPEGAWFLSNGDVSLGIVRGNLIYQSSWIPGYALPRYTQLTVTSYYAASSASHYGISLLTRHVEGAHFSNSQQNK